MCSFLPAFATEVVKVDLLCSYTESLLNNQKNFVKCINDVMSTASKSEMAASETLDTLCIFFYSYPGWRLRDIQRRSALIRKCVSCDSALFITWKYLMSLNQLWTALIAKNFRAGNQRWATQFQRWCSLKQHWTELLFDGLIMKFLANFWIFLKHPKLSQFRGT